MVCSNALRAFEPVDADGLAVCYAVVTLYGKGVRADYELEIWERWRYNGNLPSQLPK